MKLTFGKSIYGWRCWSHYRKVRRDVGSRFWKPRGEEGACRSDWASSGYSTRYVSGIWISGALGPDCLSITAHILLYILGITPGVAKLSQ